MKHADPSTVAKEGSSQKNRCTNAHYTSSQAASLSCQLCTITLKYQITFRSHLQTVQVYLLLQFNCRQPWASFCRILHQIIWCASMNPAVVSALVFRHFNPSLIPLCPRRFDAITRVCVCVFLYLQAFEVCVPVGGGRGSSRKITYTNPYTSSRTFLLRSDHPDLLQFKEDKFQVK